MIAVWSGGQLRSTAPSYSQEVVNVDVDAGRGWSKNNHAHSEHSVLRLAPHSSHHPLASPGLRRPRLRALVPRDSIRSPLHSTCSSSSLPATSILRSPRPPSLGDPPFLKYTYLSHSIFFSLPTPTFSFLLHSTRLCCCLVHLPAVLIYWSRANGTLLDTRLSRGIPIYRGMARKPASERGRSTTSREEPVAQHGVDSRPHAGRVDRVTPRTSSIPQTSSNPSLNEKSRPRIARWTLGILNDRETEEVPGTVLLLSSERNEPLGLEHQHARRSSSSMPPQPVSPQRRRSSIPVKKKTKDGQMILDPQPDDSLNDPLNWPAWRRDCSLLSLGFYCMLGGGMTPILAAGFNNVAQSFDVTYSQVALTTGLYMMGLGVGSVIFSPTAILWGKRPVYLGSAILFIVTSIWCAEAPSFAQLATARVFQGISVSPVECLPSATIAEIFFLHERAFRVGIYTLLLLGGKNLVPLVSAVIIQALGWRWVFW